jgi:hypothetical protein
MNRPARTLALRFKLRLADRMPDIPMHELEQGDRLQLSKLGKQRNPRMGAGLCTVVSVASERMSKDSAMVRFDGNVSVTRMHLSYLEPIPSRPAL